MGNNSASILIKLKKGMTALDVARAVDGYYAAHGARRGPARFRSTLTAGSIVNPTREPARGKSLGVAISQPWAQHVDDGGSPKWISIIDSERYFANLALAAALATTLDTSTHSIFTGDVSGTYEVLEFGPRIRRRPSDCLACYVDLDPKANWLFRSYAGVSSANYVSSLNDALEAQARVVARTLDGRDLDEAFETSEPAPAEEKFDWARRETEVLAVRDGARRLADSRGGWWPREAVFGAWFRSVMRDDREAAHVNSALQGVTVKHWKKQWSEFERRFIVESIWSELEALPAPDARSPRELLTAARAGDPVAAASLAVHASLTGNPLLCRYAAAVMHGRSWVESFYRDKVSV